MKQYRIKPEAVQFILEKHATAIYDLNTWNDMCIDIKALEEVKPAQLTYGHNSEDQASCSLGGFDKRGAKFHFTVTFPSVKYSEYNKFSKGRVIRELMDRIQSEVDSFYQDFINDKMDVNNES